MSEGSRGRFHQLVSLQRCAGFFLFLSSFFHICFNKGGTPGVGYQFVHELVLFWEIIGLEGRERDEMKQADVYIRQRI